MQIIVLGFWRSQAIWLSCAVPRLVQVVDAGRTGLQGNDSELLAPAGDLIYKGLRDGFRGEVFGGPPAAPAGASIQQLAADVQQLVSIMADKGYALKATVSSVKSSSSGSGGSFTLSLQGPCNLWGMSALGARRSLVVNAFDVMVTDGYLRASGRRSSFRLQLTDAGLEEHWTVV